MVDNWGKSTPGDYVGVPPTRGGMGFGRRIQPGAPAEPAPANTLSAAAQEFIAAERARNAAAMAESNHAEAQRSTSVPDALVNDIDFEIGGTDTQYLVVELDPGEAIIAENGAMIWKDSAVSFDTVMGDGAERGIVNKLISAGTNLLGGENLFLGEFRHAGAGKARLALGGRSPGNILPVRLEAMGGRLVCQRGAFLAAAKGINVTVRWAGSFWTGMEGGEGFVLQELAGTGWAFIHVGGSLIERELKPGEQLHVDAGCIAAFEPSVRFDTDNVGTNFLRDVKNTLTGGEGWMFARLTGPGKVWIQSLPFSRLTRTIVSEAKLKPEGTTFGQGDRGLDYDDVVDGMTAAMKLFK
jgi:uncharacterized protein (TIGR00266 family)